MPAFTSDDYTASLDAVCERLGVNQEYNEPSTREQKLQEGCVKLGWHVDAMPRGVRNCAQGKECGYCGLGCRVGAKQSVVKTWLADAHAARHAADRPHRRSQRVLVEGGRARGIVGVTADGHRVTVRSRAVIAACGAIHTPALLRRSGLQNENIGKHLKLHPAAVVFGVFDEELKPWEGVMQALYSDQYRDLDDGYGLKYETAAQHPHLFIPFAPWRGAREHYELMEAISNTVPIGVLLRDRDGGEVRVGRDGEPVVRYRLSEFDAGHLRTGIDGAAQMLEAAARGGSSPRTPSGSAYDPGGRARAAAVHGRRRRRRLRRRAGRPELVPHHGLGADGRLAGDLGLRSDRRRPGTCATCTCSTARRSRPPPASTRRSRSRRSRT